MQLDPAKESLLDDTFTRFADELRAAGDETAAVTLAYTHSLHRSWRTILRMLPLQPGWRVLDAACGLGILSFELAANLALDIDAVDIEAGFVGHAGTLLERLRADGVIPADRQVALRTGDVRSLPYEDGRFDIVFLRELLQFLPEPVAAVSELLRVLRPGGLLCISDTDDGLRITWPPPSPVFERLVGAVTTVHRQRGGDRQAGRKLSTYLRSAGFAINSVVVLPEAHHRLVGPDDAERALVLEQLRAARGRVVDAGVMTAADYDADLAALQAEPPFEEFRMDGRVVVLGQRPSGPAAAG